MESTKFRKKFINSSNQFMYKHIHHLKSSEKQ